MTIEPEITKVYSLGGCVVHEICKRLGTEHYEHLNHFWRRPTIALMSEPVVGFYFNTTVLPKGYVNYFINDATCQHIKELENLQDDTVLIFDVTRDLYTGVLDLGEGRYILDPNDAHNIMDGITKDTMSMDIMTQAAKREIKAISAMHMPETFLGIWKESFARFVEFSRKKFKRLILQEIYLATETMPLREGTSLEFYRSTVFNPLLEKMYAFARTLEGVEFVTVDRSKMITANDVPWTGPFWTHFIEESYILFCSETDKILRDLNEPDNRFIINTLFESKRKLITTSLESEKNTASVEKLTNDVASRALDSDLTVQRTRIDNLAQLTIGVEQKVFSLDDRTSQLEAFIQELRDTLGALPAMTPASYNEARLDMIANRAIDTEQQVAELREELARRPTNAYLPNELAHHAERLTELESKLQAANDLEQEAHIAKLEARFAELHREFKTIRNRSPRRRMARLTRMFRKGSSLKRSGT